MESNEESIDYDKIEIRKSLIEKEKLKVTQIRSILFEIPKRYVIFFDLLNEIFFNSVYSDNLDANFISKYNSKDDNYLYLVERLMGRSINEDEVFKLNTVKYNFKSEIDLKNKHTNYSSRALSFEGCECHKENYIWNIYINNTLFSLNQLIENNRIIQKDDKIEFMYEQM